MQGIYANKMCLVGINGDSQMFDKSFLFNSTYLILQRRSKYMQLQNIW